MYNIHKDNKIRFDWDRNKEKQNIKKHNVSFSEAALVFYDPDALIITDPDHSDDEERFVIAGMDKQARVITAVFCLRDNEKVIRIISAREATNKEYIDYFQRRD